MKNKELEFNEYEYNTLIKAIKKQLFYELEQIKNDVELTQHDKDSGIITWGEAAERTESLLEKLGAFTTELNNSGRKVVKLVQQ
jgi:hypothetical protein